MLLLLAACTGTEPPSTTTVPVTTSPVTTSPVTTSPVTTSPVTTSPVTTSPEAAATTSQSLTISEPVIPGQLAGFALDTVRLDGAPLLVAIADTSELRRQGLMNVVDLGGLDGMLFVFEQETTGGFWMKDTVLPLDIAFFTAEGEFVDGFAMEPCTTAECPTYRPSGAYRYALELPQGNMPDQIEMLELRPEPSP